MYTRGFNATTDNVIFPHLCNILFIFNATPPIHQQDIDIEQLGISHQDRTKIHNLFQQLVDEHPCYREGDTDGRFSDSIVILLYIFSQILINLLHFI